MAPTDFVVTAAVCSACDKFMEHNRWCYTVATVFIFDRTFPSGIVSMPDKLPLPKNSLFQSSKLMVSAALVVVVSANIVIVWFDGKRYSFAIMEWCL